MSKSAGAWITVFAITALEAGAFVAWKGYGLDEAGNVLRFWLWLLAVVGILLLLVMIRVPRDFVPASRGAPRSRLRTAIEAISTIVMIAALAWYGQFIIAAVYTLGQGGFMWVRSRRNVAESLKKA